MDEFLFNVFEKQCLPTSVVEDFIINLYIYTSTNIGEESNYKLEKKVKIFQDSECCLQFR